MAKIYTIQTNCDTKIQSAEIFNLQGQKREESLIYAEVLKTFRRVFELVDFNYILNKN